MPAESAPSGEIISPADGSTVTGDFAVKVHVTDNTNIAKVSIRLSGPGDASAKQTTSPASPETTYTSDEFSVAGWANGTIHVSLWAEDSDHPAAKVQTIEVLLEAPVACVPDCGGKACGDDGCGGECSPGCGTDETCGADGLCEAGPSVGCTDGWCLIPAGSFMMGSPETEACRYDSEGPAHQVTITRSFWMKQTEVTQAEWQAAVGNNPSYFSDCPTCPVETVNWYDAAYFCNLLSASEGLESCYLFQNCWGQAGESLSCDECMDCDVTWKSVGLDCTGYRLPTEAEWEYAARAGTSTAYWSGGNVGLGGEAVCGDTDPDGITLSDVGWYSWNSGDRTHPVGELLPNDWGLLDVHGNVGEWVADWFDWAYYGSQPEDWIDPLGPLAGLDPVRGLRGGSWYDDAGSCRSALRSYNSPGYDYRDLGFRPVRSVP